jgi:signal transduction histidine kinase
MRTSLLASLLALAVLMSALFLLLVRTIGERQIERGMSGDMARSLATFQTIEQQRRSFLVKEAVLLADLPSLKALLTTADRMTVQDGAEPYWHTSESDLFALLGPSGDVLALYSTGPPLDPAQVAAQLRSTLGSSTEGGSSTEAEGSLFSRGRLFATAACPVYFGTGGLLLGYVSIGYELDDKLAREVAGSTSSEITFAVRGQTVASTLDPGRAARLLALLAGSSARPESGRVVLAGEPYLAASVLLRPATPVTPPVTLVLLKSITQATALLRRLDEGIVALGLLAMLVGAALAFWLGGRVTRPLQALLNSTRALALGHFDTPVAADGPREISELGLAFETMRVAMKRAQAELLASERLATIGQMARSVSHDLRHYLSPIYANAEFLASPKISPFEQAELLEEITASAHGMTDLLDSLLIFSRTGKPMQPVAAPLDGVLEQAVARVRAHPSARDVHILVESLPPASARIDAQEMQRAVYNLLLNACQAAKKSEAGPRVRLALLCAGESVHICVEDNGPGILEAVRERLFEPFIGEGKESGMGLGLTIVKHIAEAHGGSVTMQASEPGSTKFRITLPAIADRSLASRSAP